MWGQLSRRATVLACVLLSACGSRTGAEAEQRPAIEPVGDAGPPARAELCDGLDDDRDGRVDEGIPSQRCGTGACAAVVAGCEDGRVPVCSPAAPRAEVCGGADEDCDGRTDEGLGFGPVGEAITLAESDELFLTNEDLVATDDGLLAFWREVRSPEATATVRALDADARPVGEPVVLPELRGSSALRAGPAADGAIPITYCGRHGDQWLTTAARLDGSGRLITAPVARGGVPDAQCSSNVAAILWTGQRHILAWASAPRDGSVPQITQLEVADRALASVRVDRLPEPPGREPVLVRTAEDRVLMVWGARDDTTGRVALRARAYDAAGSPRGETIALPAPTDAFSYGRVDAVARAGGGALVLGASVDAGAAAVLLLDADGQLLSIEPLGAPLVDDTVWFPEVDLEARPEGGAYVALGGREVRIARMEEDGAVSGLVTIEARPEPGGAVGGPAIAVRGDRLVVSWWELQPYELRPPAAQLHVRSYGCVDVATP